MKFFSKTNKEYLEDKINVIKEEVELLSASILIDSDFEQLKNCFFSKYLIRQGINISKDTSIIEKEKDGTKDYYNVVCQKHCKGDSHLFELKPNPYISKYGRSFNDFIKLQNDSLLISLKYSEEDIKKATFNREFIIEDCNQKLSIFYENIDNVNNEIEPLNQSLKVEVEKILKYCKEKALSDDEINKKFAGLN